MQEAPTAQAAPPGPGVTPSRTALPDGLGLAMRVHLAPSQRKISAGCASSAHPDKQEPPTAHAVEADRAEIAYSPPGIDAGLFGVGQGRLDAARPGVSGRVEVSAL